jgi:hypothetical protein
MITKFSIRKHAEELLLLPQCVGSDLVAAWGPGGEWTEAGGGVYAPEEVYFPTMLSILGYLRDDPVNLNQSKEQNKQDQKQEVMKKMVTYAKWTKKGLPSPDFLHLTQALVDHIK